MPMAIPFIGALFTGTGLFAAGGTIAAGIGGFLGSSMLGGVLAGALGGALIGAAMGGLTSLVMGGDIGKGMLFGAIGGAVTGGIGGFFDAQAFAAAGSGEGISNAISSSGFTDSMMQSGKTISSTGVMQDTVSASVAEGSKQAAGAGFFGKLGEAGTSALVEGGIGLIGSTMSGMGEQERWEQQMAAELSEAEKQRQHEMEKLKMTLSANASGGGGGSAPDRDWAAELAENRRQFDIEVAQRKDEFAKTMGIRKDELYAPMEYQTAARERAAGALAQVKTNRGQYKEGNTIKQQVTQADVPLPKPEEATP